MDWHNLNVQDVLKKFKVNQDIGLNNVSVAQKQANFGKNIFSNNLVNSAYEVWKAVCGRVKRPALVAKGPGQKIRLMEFLNAIQLSVTGTAAFYFSLAFHIIFIYFL